MIKIANSRNLTNSIIALAAYVGAELPHDHRETTFAGIVPRTKGGMELFRLQAETETTTEVWFKRQDGDWDCETETWAAEVDILQRRADEPVCRENNAWSRVAKFGGGWRSARFVLGGHVPPPEGVVVHY